MIARAQQTQYKQSTVARTGRIQLTIEELNTLLTGKTANDKVDTVPEIVEAFEEGSDPIDMRPMTNIEIEEIINNSVNL